MQLDPAQELRAADLRAAAGFRDELLTAQAELADNDDLDFVQLQLRQSAERARLPHRPQAINGRWLVGRLFGHKLELTRRRIFFLTM
jgi:hypothetical protein